MCTAKLRSALPNALSLQGNWDDANHLAFATYFLEMSVRFVVLTHQHVVLRPCLLVPLLHPPYLVPFTQA